MYQTSPEGHISDTGLPHSPGRTQSDEAPNPTLAHEHTPAISLPVMASQKPQVDIGQGFVNYLRKQARSRQKPTVCSVCNLDLPSVTDHVQFEAHIKTVHGQLYNSKTSDKEKEDWLNAQWKASQPTSISERLVGHFPLTSPSPALTFP